MLTKVVAQPTQVDNGIKLIRLLFLFLILFSAVFLNFAGHYIILAILLIIFIWALLGEKLWLLPILSIPALAYGQFIYFPVTASWTYEASLTEVLIILIFSIFMADKFINGRLGDIKTSGLLYTLAAYLFIAAASYINIVDFRLYVNGIKAVVFGFLAYFLSENLLDNKKKIDLYIYGLAATALILSGQIFVKFYQMGWSDKFFFERSSITIPLGPIATTAAILALILPIILSHYFHLDKNNKIRPLILISFIAGVLAVFMTLGKAAILCLAIGLAYLFFKLKDKRIIFILTLFAFTIFSYIFLTSFFSGLLERISHVFADANSKFRILEYKTGWKVIKENPWFGVGAGQQLHYFKKLLDNDNPQLVNNVFFQAWIDYGLIGLTALALIFAQIGRKTLEALRSIKKTGLLLGLGFIAALVVSFFNGLVEVTFFALPYGIIFWSIVGVFNNLEKYEKNNLSYHN